MSAQEHTSPGRRKRVGHSCQDKRWAAVLFGTHNWKSVDGVLQGMEKRGMARRVEGPEGPLFVPDEVAERIALGQLYGAQLMTGLLPMGY